MCASISSISWKWSFPTYSTISERKDTNGMKKPGNILKKNDSSHQLHIQNYLYVALRDIPYLDIWQIYFFRNWLDKLIIIRS